MHDKPTQPINLPLSDTCSTDASNATTTVTRATKGVAFAGEITVPGVSPISQPFVSEQNGTVLRSVGDLLRQGRKFACVYADPPWMIGEGNELFVTAFSHLPIPSLVEDYCHLHMWATDDSLFAAKAVMEAWGFTFKGALICLNTLGRPGNYWVEAHEYLLLGVRGGLPLMERGMNSWMRACREPDGNSPDNIRRLIERVSPGPYLHLFGQKPISGWTVYSSMAGRDFSSYPVSAGMEADDAEAASS